MKILIIGVFALVLFASPLPAWFRADVDTVEVLYPNGNLKEQYQTVYFSGYDKTDRYGFYKSWFENGSLECDGQYIGNNKAGTWVSWDSTGCRVSEVSYVDGVKNGSEIEWNSNGSAKKMLHYRDGNLHGLCSWKKTSKTSTVFSSDGCLSFLHQAFYLNGEVLVTIIEDSLTYYESCASIMSPYYNANLGLWVEWSDKECNFFVGKKVDGKRQGLWTLWSKEGDMIKTEYYDAGVLIE